jgi:hypothetical protein
MNSGARGRRLTRRPPLGFLLLAAALAALPTAPSADDRLSSAPEAGLSKRESAGCAAKVDRLEKFARTNHPNKSQTTKFTEVELNSYLAYELSRKYHPSLKSLLVRLEGPGLQGTAIVDFDQLGMHSTRAVTRVIARLLSGTHTLEVRGKFVAADGQGQFVLDQARFDSLVLPNLLVEEIITTVGKKQKPPFDPMTPSPLPYRIRRVETRRGFIDVYQ